MNVVNWDKQAWLRGWCGTAVILMVIGLLPAGCGNQAGGGAAEKQPTLEEQISAIEKNPTMPESAKANAIQSLKQQQNAAAARMSGSGAAQAQAAASRTQK